MTNRWTGILAAGATWFMFSAGPVPRAVAAAADGEKPAVREGQRSEEPDRAAAEPIVQSEVFDRAAFETANAAPGGGVAGAIGPDVIVSRIIGVNSYGHIGNISAYAVGATSCNIGDQPASWLNDTEFNQHPVIAQNMYRLMNNRFEQIGQSWLKHGFLSVNGNECGSCQRPPGGTSQLGVNCSDPYDAGLNGTQSNLGPRSQVNPFTGFYPYPVPIVNRQCVSPPCDRIQRRLQVHDADLDPALNPDSTYFVDVHYVTTDELAAPRANNASYRRIQVLRSQCPSPPCFRHVDSTPFAADEFGIQLTTETTVPGAGIRAWNDRDSSVVETDVNVPQDGLMILATKVLDLGDGHWQYEYALQNLNCDRAAASFRVPLPPGAVVTDIGFHDVDAHSGEPMCGEDWRTDINPAPGWIRWDVPPPTCTPPNELEAVPNALYWGTMYNFRFRANVQPDNTTTLIRLFRPGFPTEVAARTIGPTLGLVDCNTNNNADPCDVDCNASGCAPPCGGSDDCNLNGVPDECESDCNENEIPDTCDIGGQTSLDCNNNQVPDECEPDCDGDHIPDVCDVHSDTDGDGFDDCEDDCPLNTPPGACTCVGDGCCYFATQPDQCFMGFTRVQCLESDGQPECLEPCRNGCVAGDRNADGDVDLWDLNWMWDCFSGSDDQPGYVQPSLECRQVYDMDSDFDVDFRDWRRLRSSVVGP